MWLGRPNASLGLSGITMHSAYRPDTVSLTAPARGPNLPLPQEIKLMSVPMYEISIPILTLGLTNISNIIDKGVAHAEARKFDSLVLLQTRFFPDMFPFSRQVQVACDVAKGCAARLAGIEVPKYEDTEATMAELKARVAKTKAFIGSVKAAQLQDAASREIVVTIPTGALKFNGLNYVTTWVLPNFYFHCSMAYALLRHNGVQLGKGDFLGAIQ
jgi:hypothetical protein